MKLLLTLLFAPFICFCQTNTKKPNTKLSDYIIQNKNDSSPSQSLGSVSNGSLKNGKLIPFQGQNFKYFDETSYLSGRAFTNDKVLKTIIDSYKELEFKQPLRKFTIMESSHKNGGKLWPHRTHQNGLSIDFMMPKIKNGMPYYLLDTIGTNHYWLTFDNDGKYSKDPSVSIDFETIAQHILILNEKAHKYQLKVSKVIIKVELKDELYSGEFGKKLKESGIYIVKSLSPKINDLHDEHYHIDFKTL